MRRAYPKALSTVGKERLLTFPLGDFINRMHSQLTSTLLLTVFLSPLAQCRNISAETHLNITALASRDGYSVLECWQLKSTGQYARSAMNWIVGGDTTRAELSIIEPRITAGEAWAPTVQ